ncbi:hypothetical protein RSOL_270510 [Rhizoctonia solani AG-3 Rhs1AP]|uniref:Uncharacterized protein n=1 Tax=Rhizoctonia solani AG-3 Rhs1AP TaxID=1086054 RepID=A0A0A1UJW3_9AGAM|nr:hypothetical protein RSOL_270510 [Rhizoctonia solani AG-3 Rhs1AP]
MLSGMFALLMHLPFHSSLAFIRCLWFMQLLSMRLSVSSQLE